VSLLLISKMGISMGSRGSGFGSSSGGSAGGELGLVEIMGDFNSVDVLRNEGEVNVCEFVSTGLES